MFKNLQIKSWLLLLIVMGASAASAEEKTIEIGTNPSNNSSTSYLSTAQEFTIGGVTFKMNNYNPKSGQIRGNQSSASSNFYLYNTTAIPGTLKSIVIELSSANTTFVDKNVYINTGDNAITSPATSGTNPSSREWTNLSGTYFCISMAKGGTSGTCNMSKITITYDDGETENPNLQDPGLAFSVTEATATMGKAFTAPTLTNNGDGTVSYTSSDEDVATVDDEGNITLVAVGETTITAKSAKTETYKAGTASYKLTVTEAPIEGVVFWSEDWSAGKADDVPSGMSEYYDEANGGGTTKLYSQSLAGGTSPELLVGKSNGYFEATIPLDGVYGDFVLTYKQNGQRLVVSANGNEIGSDASAGTYNRYFTIDEGTENLVIKFQSTTSSNVRLDDIVLTATNASKKVSVSEVGYATFSFANPFNSNYGLDLDGAAIKAYMASSVSGNVVNMTKVTNAPVNTGLFLQGTEGEAVTAELPLVDAEAVGTNLLVATDGTEVAASTEGKYHYVFAKQNDDLGFYNLASPLTMTAGKAYLESATKLEKAAGAKVQLSFGDGTATSISTLTVGNSQTEGVFDLQGRRVERPTKGLYIMNGKKYIVK